jgi:hypothetical protein
MKAKRSITHFQVLDILRAKCSKNEGLQRVGEHQPTNQSLGKGVLAVLADNQKVSLTWLDWSWPDFF